MSVSTFQQTDSTTQPVTTWSADLDGNMSVLTRLAVLFAPHQQSIPNMAVALDPGHVFDGTTLTELPAQVSATITAPVTNPRIDRVVIDQVTGLVSVVTGSEAAKPAPPAIPAGKMPVAQILLATATTAITNALITDERDFSFLGGGITGVTAGTGLTGGGTDGTVTISLAPVANNRVLGNNSGSTATPSAIGAGDVLNMIGGTQGDVLYRDAGSWTVLPPGTAGQVLQTQGAGANPQWGDVVGAAGAAFGYQIGLIF